MKPARDAAGLPVDLSNCDREPIHIPGRIQSHGVLLALREDGLVVTQASANAGARLGCTTDALVGAPLSSLVDRDDWSRCASWLASVAMPATCGEPLRVRGRAFDASAHRHDGALIVELEDPLDDGRAPLDGYRAVRAAMARLLAAGDLQAFCEIAADEARALVGFDRVIVYRFDAAWNGQVFAESKRDDLAPLLGLHFPASDIPEQARRLYHLSKLRLIADADDDSSPIVPPTNPLTGRPLDLSYAALRSVSPMHIQYMKNMGVRTSMSVSLMRGERLWGLLSCMQYERPRRVAPVVRDALAFLGELVSAQIAVKEDAQGHGQRVQTQAIGERLMQRMSAEADLVRALAGEDLLALAGAGGAAVVHDRSVALFGATPTEEQVKRLVGWLRVHADGDVFHTDSLARLNAEAEAYADVASGLVAISTTKGQGHYVLWFRPEVLQTVDWGGDPRKPVDATLPGGQLSPRRSFALWQETVRRTSLPWQEADIEAARMLRNAIVAVVVRRAEELTRLNAELERSNADLDAFAFVTSHDLKEPLRGIHNYATFLLEDYGDRLESDGIDKLQTLVRLSQRLEDIVESLLAFSRLGRADLDVAPTDLDEVLSLVRELLKVTLAQARVELVVPRPLPVLLCDRTQAEVVLTNLVTNAIKYNDKPVRRVEVGYREPVDGGDGRPVLYVRDNGIGIPEKHQSIVFRMFKRLHGRDKFGGGTGAGLAFVKKIVERHGGTIWVESTVGEGSTFYFTLGMREPR